jgi:hypothetical protein
MDSNEIEEALENSIPKESQKLEMEIEIEEGLQDSIKDILDGILMANEIKNVVGLIIDVYYGSTGSDNNLKLTPLIEGMKTVGLHCGYGNHTLQKEELSELASLFRNQNIINALACTSPKIDGYETRAINYGTRAFINPKVDGYEIRKMLTDEIAKEIRTNPLQYPKLFPESTRRMISK